MCISTPKSWNKRTLNQINEIFRYQSTVLELLLILYNKREHALRYWIIKFLTFTWRLFFFFKWLIIMIAYSSLTKVAGFHSQFLMRKIFPSFSYCISHQFLTFQYFSFHFASLLYQHQSLKIKGNVRRLSKGIGWWIILGKFL